MIVKVELNSKDAFVKEVWKEGVASSSAAIFSNEFCFNTIVKTQIKLVNSSLIMAQLCREEVDSRKLVVFLLTVSHHHHRREIEID